MVLTDKLTAIGNAIRAKTGGAAELTLDQMVTEIGNISVGGGGNTDMEDMIIKRTLITCNNPRITELKEGAFCNNKTLVEVNLPNVTTIGGLAFYNTFMTELSFPLTTNVGANAFYYCPKLVTLSLPKLETFRGYTFRNCDSLVNLNLPSVKTLPTSGINTCKALVKLELPSLTNIATLAFQSCSAFETLIIRNTDTVVTLAATAGFSGTKIASGTGLIYVPDDLVDEYKAATNWSTYADQIKPLSEYVEVTE